jgi:hypothetical protein
MGSLGECGQDNKASSADEKVGRPMLASSRFFTFLDGNGVGCNWTTFTPGDNAGLDHNGFEDAVRPTKSDPIQPCFVMASAMLPSARSGALLRFSLRQVVCLSDY